MKLKILAVLIALLVAHPVVADDTPTLEQIEVFEKALEELKGEMTDEEFQEKLQKDLEEFQKAFDGTFELWNDCKPVNLWITYNGDDTDINLTEERIRTAVESRLRGARIYADSVEPGNIGAWLNFQISIISIKNASDTALGYAYFIQPVLAFQISRLDTTGTAILWTDGGLIGYGGDNVDSHILQTVAEQTDHFINEYLRVNTEACK